ncbi:unnamed protein product [Cyprideis torosa]|uniref:Uncharacterized protein n=1 Tax=Cyprideis torosa TaxID=163714 RepID=A0A7R8WSX6_9CRUS|nr:unnamed protein product [Cyprideis torosa]CAG0909676.1 unnamed protein product [Cyprideis torosa]
MNILFQTVVVSVLVTLSMSVEGAEECKRELTRIVGGEEANLSEYPFAVSIQLNVGLKKIENDIMLLRLAEPFDLEAGDPKSPLLSCRPKKIRCRCLTKNPAALLLDGDSLDRRWRLETLPEEVMCAGL